MNGIRIKHEADSPDGTEKMVMTMTGKGVGVGLDSAQNLLFLANSYRNDGKTREAEALYQHVLGLVSRCGGQADARMAEVLLNYAELLAKDNRSAQASEMRKRAREICGKKHRDIAATHMRPRMVAAASDWTRIKDGR